MLTFIGVSPIIFGASTFVQPGRPLQTSIRRTTLVAHLRGTGDFRGNKSGFRYERMTVGSDVDKEPGRTETIGKSKDKDCSGIGLVATSNPLDKRVLFGEYLSTTLFVVVSVMTSKQATVAPPLPNAAIIAVIAAAFMPVCGAHLNPAITLALLSTGKVHLKRAMAFIPTQVLAGMTGMIISRFLGAKQEVPALPISLSKSGLLSATLLEFCPMFLVTCIVFLTAVATEEEGGVGPKIAPLYIGFTVLACICAFQPAMFNPARAIAVATFSGVLAGHWVYWVGPILGAVSAATVSQCSIILSSYLSVPSQLPIVKGLFAYIDCVTRRQYRIAEQTNNCLIIIQ